jgi:hypothetical protein
MKKFSNICAFGVVATMANIGLANAADMSVDERIEQASPFFGEFEVFMGKIHLSGDLDGDWDDEPNNARFAGGAVKFGMAFGGGWLAIGEIFGERTTTGHADDSYASG